MLEVLPVDEYLCLTLLSPPGEAEAAFKAQLSAFWTHMLRNHESDFEKIYAEHVAFERLGNRLSRKYLIEATVWETLQTQLRTHGIDHEPIDADDLYSKYEAAPPEWFWIEH